MSIEIIAMRGKLAQRVNNLNNQKFYSFGVFQSYKWENATILVFLCTLSKLAFSIIHVSNRSLMSQSHILEGTI